MQLITRRTWLWQTLAISGAALQLVQGEETPLVGARQIIGGGLLAHNESAQVLSAVKIHPNGKWIFSGGDRHAISVWDCQTEQQLDVLEQHTDWVRGLAISASGESLVSVGNDGRVLLWDTANRQLRSKVQHFTEACTAVEHHPTESQIAVATASGKVYWIDLNTNAQLHCFEKLGDDVRAVAFSSDGKLLAAGNRTGEIHVWNLHDRTLLSKAPAHTQRVRALIFSADNGGLLSAGDDGLVTFTSLSAGFRGFHYPRQNCRILAMTICQDNKIATAGSDNCIRLWDGKSRELLGEIGKHQGSVAALDCLGDRLVSAGFDTQLCVWHLSPTTSVRTQAEERVSARPTFRLE
jgi:WD40 repeat protein